MEVGYFTTVSLLQSRLCTKNLMVVDQAVCLQSQQPASRQVGCESGCNIIIYYIIIHVHVYICSYVHNNYYVHYACVEMNFSLSCAVEEYLV